MSCRAVLRSPLRSLRWLGAGAVLLTTACGPVTVSTSQPPLPVEGICEAEPPGIPFEGNSNAFQRQVFFFEGESAQGPVEVRIVRDHIADGVGESAEFQLMMMTVFVGDEGACVTDANRLEYENTHHNWDDWAQAEIDGVRYLLEMEFFWGENGERGWNDRLTGFAASGQSNDEVVFGPIELEQTAGPERF